MNLKSIWPLIALMALTRMHHFGDALSLPDASLAVFFLAGRVCSSRWLLAGLLLEAAVLDYVAIHFFSVSDWCVSPAYVFLIPTYAVLWYAGRYSAVFKALNPVEFMQSVGLMALATTAAFAISNGSFYLFSGRYNDLALGHYFSAVAQYYLPYLSAGLLYAVLGLAVIKLLDYLPESITRKTA
jgi:hypothetical protein